MLADVVREHDRQLPIRWIAEHAVPMTGFGWHTTVTPGPFRASATMAPIGQKRTLTLTLANQIHQACTALGLRAELGFIAKFDGAPELQTVAKITGPQSESCMLIVHNFEDIKPFTSLLAAAGFGYSVMDEPCSDEAFDLESWREVFRDWSLLPN